MAVSSSLEHTGVNIKSNNIKTQPHTGRERLEVIINTSHVKNITKQSPSLKGTSDMIVYKYIKDRTQTAQGSNKSVKWAQSSLENGGVIKPVNSNTITIFSSAF